MKTSLLFLAGYALAILVFFGGKLYAESLTAAPRAAEEKWIPTHLLVKISKIGERERKKDGFLGEASYFQVNMAAATLKLSGNQAVITTVETKANPAGASIQRITTILNYHQLLSPNHPAGTVAQGFVDVIEVSDKGRLLSLNTYPIQAVELVHSAGNER